MFKTQMPTAFSLGILSLLLFAGSTHAADYVFPETIGVIATRSFQDSMLGSADTLVVTVSLSNAEPDSLRNLYFADHLPGSFFDLFTEEVRVNGAVLADTEYVHEVGLPDEVFAGTVPHRWVIEAPADSLGSRPCSYVVDPSGGVLQIVYTARCTTSGDHCFPSYTWAGQLTAVDTAGEEAFGYSDSVSITITDVPEAVDDLTPLLSGSDMLLVWSRPSRPMVIDHYVVYRDTFPGFDTGSGDSIGTTVDTFYVDPGVEGIGSPGLNCYYLVRGVDTLGKESDDSNCAGEFDKDLAHEQR